MSPKKIHLIRHGQGFHNLYEDYAIRDPLLTPDGERQCNVLSKKFDDMQSIDCIVASPLRRTLYTALLTFQPLLEAKPDMRITALPELQETGAIPSDIGFSQDELQREFQQQPVDFSLLTDDWNNKTCGPFRPRTDLITNRSRNARKFLQGRKENEVAVVTHGGLLHFLTDDWTDSMAGDGTGWGNCELRTYTFDTRSPEAIENAAITETSFSLTRRNHISRLLTPQEQSKMKMNAQRSWAAAGYIALADDSDITNEVPYRDSGKQSHNQ